MKFVGIVQWTNHDKHENPIAGVRPLIEWQRSELRTVDALDEFPTQGLAFWWNAQGASENSLILFRREPNPGQKDEFKVVDPKPIYEVLDLQRYGTEAKVRAVLSEGLHLPGTFSGSRFLVLCNPGLLIGPVELNRVNGKVTLVARNLHRLPSYENPEVFRIAVDQTERLFRVDDTPNSGFVDWDDDRSIFNRALQTAARMAKQSGHSTFQTKKQIEEVTRDFATHGVGPDAQLDLYRIKRSLELLKITDVVANHATEFVEVLQEHPAIKASLDELRENVRKSVEESARVDLEQRLKSEHDNLRRVNQSCAEKKDQLSKLENQEIELQSKILKLAEDADSAVNARVLSAVDRPMELLAEVSVLRPFFGLGTSQTANAQNARPSTRLNWSTARGVDIRDKVSLRSMLTSAARAKGVDPSMMLQVHAAVAAGLMPVTLGPSALAALSAYAHGACGGRMAIVHVSPSAIKPDDLNDASGSGLMVAASAAREFDGISLVVLEGANRSPLEASVLPLLQLKELGFSPLTPTPGLRLAAAFVVGATTVPVTPQLWNHASAINSEPSLPSKDNAVSGDIALSCELFAPGDEPSEVIDELLETWPHCRELRPVMIRLGSILTRFYDEESRVSDALLNSLILPYIATAFTVDEQEGFLSKTGDTLGPTAEALYRLRRRLA